MSAEEWRRVPGFADYEVSDQMRIRSWRTYNRPVVPNMMHPYLAKNGYYYVRVTATDGARRNCTLHSLIAAAFLGPRPAGLCIRHLDGNPVNCVPSNLAYGTDSENMFDRVRHGTHHLANKVVCKNGHEFTPENTRLEPRGRGRFARRCLTCQREYDRARSVA